MPKIRTYPEMNEKITDLLRFSDEPVQLYAAARIEELEKEVAQGGRANGEWSIAIGYDPARRFMCDRCQKMTYEPSNYCPACGARMTYGG